MRNQLKEVWEKTRNGEITDLVFSIEGKEYRRRFRPKERLILLGGGHISQALCNFASQLEFSIVVVDDRPSFANRTRFPQAAEIICKDFKTAIKDLAIHAGDYVAVITRGHRFDAECLHAIYESGHPEYLGLLGSRRRTIALCNSLEEEGIDRDFLDGICTPIGLEIGALTVEEISISILAQMIQYRRKNQRRKNTELLAEETFHEDVLIDLIENDQPKALLMVYETSGSTPVKSGCFMTLDQNFQPKGTIGGGCIENAALLQAFPLIGKGESKIYEANLSQEDAEREGMVCGGQMKIYMTDL